MTNEIVTANLEKLAGLGDQAEVSFQYDELGMIVHLGEPSGKLLDYFCGRFWQEEASAESGKRKRIITKYFLADRFKRDTGEARANIDASVVEYNNKVSEEVLEEAG